jgi:hypothetical protein
MRKISLIIAIICLSSFVLLAQGTPAPSATPKPLPDIGITATLALGEVTAINAEQKNLILKTKDGEITIVLADTTEYQKASAEDPSNLKLVTAGTMSDIGIGDRLIASGKVADDKKSMVSRRVIVMTKADLSKRQQAETEAWTKGVNGKVATVSPTTKELTITMRGLMGERAVTVDTSNARFLRYSQGSVKFSDAMPGSFSEVKSGDQLRARGTRSEDGAHFVAEEIISGSFRTAGGAITAIDAVKNEITINDVITKKPVTISLAQATTLRKFPAEMAQTFLARQMGMMPGANGQGGQGGQRLQGVQGAQGTAPQNGGTPPAGAQGGQRPGGGGARDFDAMLERLPAITLADLKVGEAIAISSIPGSDPARVTAVKLLAGVEPFLNAPAMQMPSGGGRTASPSINIPGLDGIGAP